MTLAPVAPGALGERLDPAATQTYLADLDTWVRERKAQLDEVDAVALDSAASESLTGDLLLSMALWKAASDRLRLLLATWDGGRVGPTERERLSVLIWGRLDATVDPALLERAGGSSAGSALALSLPEACRLSDALLQQLRGRLALDPAADANARRLKDIRAQVERLRDQVALEPGGVRGAVTRQVDELAARADVLAGKLSRGGDIGGLVGPLENEAARLERDLIVGGAQRREALDQVASAGELRADLQARGAALTALADRCVAEVDPAPRMAVPDVAALGPVPTTLGELTAYRTRLDRVAAAMNLAHDSYTKALESRTNLLAQLDAAVVRAGAAGVGSDPDVVAAEASARAVLDRRPTPIDVARHLVAAHQAWVARAGTVTTPPVRARVEESA